MLIIEVKNNNIRNALKSYKRKVRDTQLMRQIRQNRFYTKPSSESRSEILQAIYRRKKSTKE